MSRKSLLKNIEWCAENVRRARAEDAAAAEALDAARERRQRTSAHLYGAEDQLHKAVAAFLAETEAAS